MQNPFNPQLEKSTKSKENRTRELQTRTASDQDKTLDHTEAENRHENLQNAQNTNSPIINLSQNHAQTSDLLDSNRSNTTSLTSKKEYLESIRLSYLVLSNPKQLSPQKKKKLLKKSFAAIQEEQQIQTNGQNIKETLKTPLKIDLKKMDQKNKLIEYSDELFLFNGKQWEKSHLDVDLKVQQLIVSNLHIPFSTIEKLKIFKPNPEQKLREIKVTYSRISDEGTIFLNLKEQNSLKKVPVNYLIFQEIIVHKLTFQNRFKETKWEKKTHICEEIIVGSYIFGEIYKKSQFFGKWEKRYIVLNNQGVHSYKSAAKKQDSTFFISRESIDYIWTRFQMVDGYLIIKAKHGMKQTEFGIPIANYSYPHYKNWLYCFYKLVASTS